MHNQINAPTLGAEKPYDEDTERSYGTLKWIIGLGALAVAVWLLFFSTAPIEPFTIEDGNGISYYVGDHETAVEIGEQFDLGFEATPLNGDLSVLISLPEDLARRILRSPRSPRDLKTFLIDAQLARDLEPHLGLVKVNSPVWTGDYFDPENGIFEPSPYRPLR
jgi:hypothetical protein